MFRLVLSIILVVAFAGASTASVMHGLNYGPDHTDHHAEMTENDLVADAEKALADGDASEAYRMAHRASESAQLGMTQAASQANAAPSYN